MPDWLMQAVGLIAGAGAVYGGVRADLRAMHERLALLEKSADRAHVRIDNIVGRGTP